MWATNQLANTFHTLTPRQNWPATEASLPSYCPSPVQFMLIILSDQLSHYACIYIQASQTFVYLHGYSISIFASYINMLH